MDALDNLYDQAAADFDAWVERYDPNGEMSMLEQIDAYYADHQRKG